MQQLKVGFIGTGVISELHARAYQSLPEARLSAICDKDTHRAEAKANSWGVEKIYCHYQDLLNDPEIDAIEVLTPQHLHKEMALAALASGKHVSVQKPMASNLAEAKEMLLAGQKSKHVARIYENFRFYPAMRKAKELVDSGDIGEPLSIRFKLTNGIGGKGEFAHDKSATWDRRMEMDQSGGGAVTFDHGYHLYSLARYFMGEIEEVFAWIGRRKDEHGYVWDSPAMITWRYAGKDRFGVWEQVWSDHLWIRSNYYAGEDRMEITGSQGILWVTKCTAEFWEVPPLLLYRDGQMRSFHDLETDWQASFTHSTRHFIDSILGKVEPELTFAEGYEVQRVAHAVQLSAKEKRVVQLKEV